MEMAIRYGDVNMVVNPSLQAHQPPGYVNRALEAHTAPIHFNAPAYGCFQPQGAEQL